MNNKKAKVLSPSEVKSKFIESLDPAIIEAVNKLLVKNYNNFSIEINQKDILEEALRIKGVTDSREREKQKKEWFESNQFDFEDKFRKDGWSVTYDGPGYNESYEPFFIFKKKK